MNFLFLQDISGQKAVEQIMQVNPYNALGYGLCLSVMGYFAYIFYLRWQKADEYAKELSKQLIDNYREVLQVLTKVEVRLADQQTMMKNVEEVRTLVIQTLEHIKNVLIRLENGKRTNP